MGRSLYYRDGYLASRTRVENVNFEKWKKANLVFGDRSGSRWTGWLDNIAIYNRFIDVSAAADRAALAGMRIANRPVIPRMNVTATLLVKGGPSLARSIAPYRRALVINRYKITEAQRQALSVRLFRLPNGRCSTRKHPHPMRKSNRAT